METPVGSGEFWGSADSEADLTTASATLDWTVAQANITPAMVAQLPNSDFWQTNQFPLPEVLAVMADSSFTSVYQTQFKVWDVDWNSLGVGVASARSAPVSLQQLMEEASNPLTSPHAVDQVYVQVDSLPPLPTPALSVTGTLGLAVALVGAVLFVSLRRRWRGNAAFGQR